MHCQVVYEIVLCIVTWSLALYGSRFAAGEASTVCAAYRHAKTELEEPTADAMSYSDKVYPTSTAQVKVLLMNDQAHSKKTCNRCLFALDNEFAIKMSTESKVSTGLEQELATKNTLEL